MSTCWSIATTVGYLLSCRPLSLDLHAALYCNVGPGRPGLGIPAGDGWNEEEVEWRNSGPLTALPGRAGHLHKERKSRTLRFVEAATRLCERSPRSSVPRTIHIVDFHCPPPLVVPSTLFVDHTAALGGAELYLRDVMERLPGDHSVLLFEHGPLCDRLKQRSISVKVAEAETGVHVFSRESGPMAALRAVPGVLKLVLEVAQNARDHQVVYANSQKSFVVAALAGLLIRRPVIWNLHDLLTAEHFSSFNTRMVVWLANTLASRVIVNSQATRAAFVEAGGRRELTTLVYNGLDADSFDGVDPAPIRDELGTEDVPLVGVFSRLAPWKGQHVLIEALEGLLEVHALIVGGAVRRGGRLCTASEAGGDSDGSGGAHPLSRVSRRCTGLNAGFRRGCTYVHRSRAVWARHRRRFACTKARCCDSGRRRTRNPG